MAMRRGGSIGICDDAWDCRRSLGADDDLFGLDAAEHTAFLALELGPIDTFEQIRSRSGIARYNPSTAFQSDLHHRRHALADAQGWQAGQGVLRLPGKYVSEHQRGIELYIVRMVGDQF